MQNYNDLIMFGVQLLNAEKNLREIYTEAICWSTQCRVLWRQSVWLKRCFMMKMDRPQEPPYMHYNSNWQLHCKGRVSRRIWRGWLPHWLFASAAAGENSWRQRGTDQMPLLLQ